MYFAANYPGDAATLTVGTASNTYTVTRRRYGDTGNNDNLIVTSNTFDSALVTTVTKIANSAGGWDYTVNLKNDGTAVTSTLADEVAAINSTAGIAEFISAVLAVGAVDTTLSAEAASAALTGGGNLAEGADLDGVDMTAVITRGTQINHPRVSFWIHPDAENSPPDALIVGMMSPKEAGSATFKNQHPVGIPAPAYTVNALSIIRGG